REPSYHLVPGLTPHLKSDALLAKHSPSVHFTCLALAERADPTARNVDTAIALIREAMALLSGYE
ncbi:hypothetical protein ACFPTO_08130, partial [Paraburkholderia denitrificans]